MVKIIIRMATGFSRRYAEAVLLPRGVAVLLGFVTILGILVWHFGGEPSGPVRYDLVRTSEIADLKAHYEDRGKNFATVISGEVPVPRLIATRLPGDLGGGVPVDERKSAFLAVVLPAVLITNREIMHRRQRLMQLLEARQRGAGIPEGDRKWLADMAKRYRTDPDAPERLRARIDVIPVSLAVAQAALESGWGTARFAQEGTALFGIRGRNGGASLAARERTGLYLRAYDTVLASVRDYAKLLNSHRAYAGFREARAGLRAAGQTPNGMALAGTLTRYSERNEDYVKTLRRIIRTNGLDSLDAARLDDER